LRENIGTNIGAIAPILLITKEGMRNKVGSIDRYKHFASGGEIMMAKGKINGRTPYGLTTVLTSIPSQNVSL
jgi:hypothetical protein